MKTFSIPYGDKTIPLQIPEEHWGELLAPSEVLPISFQKGLMQALKNSLDSLSLDEFLIGCKSLLILVNDETRPTPTGRVLESLWSEISRLPNQDHGGYRDSRKEQ